MTQKLVARTPDEEVILITRCFKFYMRNVVHGFKSR